MALNIPDGFGEVAWIHDCTYGTPPFITTMGFNIVGATGPNPLVSVANKCVKAWGANWAGIQEVHCQLQKCTVTVADGDGYGSVDSDRSPGFSTGSGTFLPPSCPMIVRKSTGLLGRQGRGRMFIPMVLNEDDAGTSGIINITRIEDILAPKLISFLEDLLDEDDDEFPFALDPVILHSKGSLHETPSPITGVSINPKVGTMRKRLR